MKNKEYNMHYSYVVPTRQIIIFLSFIVSFFIGMYVISFVQAREILQIKKDQAKFEEFIVDRSKDRFYLTDFLFFLTELKERNPDIKTVEFSEILEARKETE